MLINLIKRIIIAFVLFLFLTFCFVVTQHTFFWPVVNGLMAVRGCGHLEGEDRSTEVFLILVQIILPTIYLISFGIVYRWLIIRQRRLN
jgi:hypothetical protein